MEKQNPKAGEKLLFLLRQQRYLYHQLKLLSMRQRELGLAGTPELLLDVVSGRRKLIEKLHQTNNKLRPIKTNWDKLSGQLRPEQRLMAKETANEIQQIIDEITQSTPPEAVLNLPLSRGAGLDELFAESGSGD